MRKFRIRAKGKYANGERKYILEKIEGNRIRTKNLPKPQKLWDVLKSNESQREKGTV